LLDAARHRGRRRLRGEVRVRARARARARSRARARVGVRARAKVRARVTCAEKLMVVEVKVSSSEPASVEATIEVLPTPTSPVMRTLLPALVMVASTAP